MLGESPEFVATLRAANLIAATDVTALILGESGTGKELLAHAIHQNSPRSNHSFVTINCAALPENLVESELFGYRKGAFSGALQDQPGRIRQARHGTLFLDEVGELPYSIQSKLLRFLENGECQPIGQSHPEIIDVRIIAATNRDLAAAVESGEFRRDLYFRLNVIPLNLPPLRQRDDDIALLIQRITVELAKHHQLDAPHYMPSAMSALRKHRWPGNVRELRNLCERMLILFSGKNINLENLPAEIRHSPSATGNGNFNLPVEGIQLDQLETSMIQQALQNAKGNQTKAARLLGLTRGTLLYRMKKFALTS